MDANMHTYYGDISGWTCGACNQWVYFGTFHSCVGSITLPTPEERTATALERIAAALEALTVRGA